MCLIVFQGLSALSAFRNNFRNKLSQAYCPTCLLSSWDFGVICPGYLLKTFKKCCIALKGLTNSIQHVHFLSALCRLWRKCMGIEPTHHLVSGALVLKTRRPTRRLGTSEVYNLLNKDIKVNRMGNFENL